jgi:hypothetical protein
MPAKKNQSQPTHNRAKRRGPYKGRTDYTPETKRTVPSLRHLLTDEERKAMNEVHRVSDKKSKYKRKATIEGRVTFMFSEAQRRARNHNLPFTLTKKWFREKLLLGQCEKTGIPFDLTPATDSRTEPFAPSPDQIVAGKGYTPDNTRLVVWIYNTMKQDFPPQDVKRFERTVAAKFSRGVKARESSITITRNV